MNRQLGRSVKRAAGKAAKKGGQPIVRLKGGPMDGWLVTHDAPALDPSWPSVPDQPGRYERVGEQDGEETAEWRPEE